MVMMGHLGATVTNCQTSKFGSAYSGDALIENFKITSFLDSGFDLLFFSSPLKVRSVTPRAKASLGRGRGVRLTALKPMQPSTLAIQKPVVRLSRKALMVSKTDE